MLCTLCCVRYVVYVTLCMLRCIALHYVTYLVFFSDEDGIHQDATWEECCSLQCSAQKPWVLVTLTYTTDPNIADHVHPFMAAIFPDASGLFQQDNVPCHTVQECFEEHDRVLNVDLASKFQRSRSDRASIRCA